MSNLLPATLLIEEFVVEVVRKRVRQLRLTIRPPQGHLRLTVPLGTREATIRELVRGKQDWIRRHQAAMQQRPPVPVLGYETGEMHYYQGQAWRLRVQEQAGRAGIRLAPDEGVLYLKVPVGATPTQRALILARWRRAQLHALVPALLAKWEPVVGVRAAAWGTCSIGARRIWLSLELSQWPLSCLEYALVHELTHLHERLHTARFWHLLDQALPEWRPAHQALRQGALPALLVGEQSGHQAAANDYLPEGKQ